MCGLPVGANRRLNLCIPKGDIVAFRETTFKLLTIYWTLPSKNRIVEFKNSANAILLDFDWPNVATEITAFAKKKLTAD